MVPPQSPPASPRVAIVTVSYGSADVLPTFLSSLPAASSDALEVVVADNKPGDGDGILLLAGQHGAGYLPLGENRGYGSAVNAAIAALPPSVAWVLISNPDVMIGEGAIDTLVATGEADAAHRLRRTGDPHRRRRLPLRARRPVAAHRRRPRPVRQPLGEQPLDQRLPPRLEGALAPPARRRLALRRLPARAPQRLRAKSAASTRATSCTSRTSTSATGSARPATATSTNRRATVTHTGAHSTTSESGRMISAHHDSARRFLNKKYSGALLWPVRVALTVGLSLRSALIRRKMNRG